MKNLTFVFVAVLLFTASSPVRILAAESFRPVYDRGAGEFVIDLVIGGEDETADDFLMEPTAVCVAPNGDVFVLEWRTSVIRRFDRDGNLLAMFGEEGEGPGYLHWPTQMEIAPDGNLWVNDMGNQRLSVFTPGGEFVTTHATDDLAWNFRIAPDGMIVTERHEWDYQGKKGGTTIRVVRSAPDYTAPVVLDSMIVKDNVFITEPVRTNSVVPFHADLAWGMLPDGNVVVANSGDYHIRVLAPSGEVVADATHETTRQKVTDDDKEAFFAGITHSDGTTVTKGAPQYMRDATTFPEFKPCFRHLRVDADGYLVFETYEGDDETAVCDVFNPSLTFVNRVRLPDLGDAVFANGFVYRLRIPDEGAASVERLRLVGAEVDP